MTTQPSPFFWFCYHYQRKLQHYLAANLIVWLYQANHVGSVDFDTPPVMYLLRRERKICVVGRNNIPRICGVEEVYWFDLKNPPAGEGWRVVLENGKLEELQAVAFPRPVENDPAMYERKLI